jgi:hypothetical protein
LKAYLNKSVLSVLAVLVQMVFKFSGCLMKEKNNYNVSAASLKTITNCKDCSESRIRISVPAFLRHYWSIYPAYMS